MLFCPEMAIAACHGLKTVTRRTFKGEFQTDGIATPTDKAGRWRWSNTDRGMDFAGPKLNVPLPLQTTWRVGAQWDKIAPRNLQTEAAETFWHAGLAACHPKPTGKDRSGMFVPTRLRPRLRQLVIRSAIIERLQDITEAEAELEGITPAPTRREGFAMIIDRLNGKGTWASNPLVWRIQFDMKAT